MILQCMNRATSSCQRRCNRLAKSVKTVPTVRALCNSTEAYHSATEERNVYACVIWTKNTAGIIDMLGFGQAAAAKQTCKGLGVSKGHKKTDREVGDGLGQPEEELKLRMGWGMGSSRLELHNR